MTAKYLQSDIQKGALSTLANADRTGPAFFVVAPFIIDCRDDRAAFRSALTEGQIATISEQYQARTLRYVGQLHRPGRSYAIEALRARIHQLDAASLKLLDQFLREWQTEKGRQPSQAGKSEGDRSVGIDILLPIDDVRLAFESGSLMGIYP